MGKTPRPRSRGCEAKAEDGRHSTKERRVKKPSLKKEVGGASGNESRHPWGLSVRSLTSSNSGGKCRREHALSIEEVPYRSESDPANARECDSTDGEAHRPSESEKSQQEAAETTCAALDAEGFTTR